MRLDEEHQQQSIIQRYLCTATTRRTVPNVFYCPRVYKVGLSLSVSSIRLCTIPLLFYSSSCPGPTSIINSNPNEFFISIFHRANGFHREADREGSPESASEIDLQSQWSATALSHLVQGQSTHYTQPRQVQARAQKVSKYLSTDKTYAILCSPRSYICRRQSQLIIRTYDLSDSGVYQCQAKNRLTNVIANATIRVDFSHYLSSTQTPGGGGGAGGASPAVPTRTSASRPDLRPNGSGSGNDAMRCISHGLL